MNSPPSGHRLDEAHDSSRVGLAASFPDEVVDRRYRSRLVRVAHRPSGRSQCAFGGLQGPLQPLGTAPAAVEVFATPRRHLRHTLSPFLPEPCWVVLLSLSTGPALPLCCASAPAPGPFGTPSATLTPFLSLVALVASVLFWSILPVSPIRFPALARSPAISPTPSSLIPSSRRRLVLVASSSRSPSHPLSI